MNKPSPRVTFSSSETLKSIGNAIVRNPLAKKASAQMGQLLLEFSVRSFIFRSFGDGSLRYINMSAGTSNRILELAKKSWPVLHVTYHLVLSGGGMWDIQLRQFVLLNYLLLLRMHLGRRCYSSKTLVSITMCAFTSWGIRSEMLGRMVGPNLTQRSLPW